MDPADKTTRANPNPYRQNFPEAWVQATDIGLDAFADKHELVAWANSPRTEAAVRRGDAVSPDGLAGTTGRTASCAPLQSRARNASAAERAARRASRRRLAILPQHYNPYYYHPNNETISWRRADSSETMRWYVFDDRKLYRPGEEVNVKAGFAKLTDRDRRHEMFTSRGLIVNYVLRDAQATRSRRAT